MSLFDLNKEMISYRICLLSFKTKLKHCLGELKQGHTINMGMCEISETSRAIKNSTPSEDIEPQEDSGSNKTSYPLGILKVWSRNGLQGDVI